MNHKKSKTLTTVILLVATMMTATAQNRGENLPPAEKRAEFQTSMMKKELSLSDAQLAEVGTINLEKALEVDQIFKIENRKERYKQYRSLMLKKEELLKGVFTPDQFEIYLRRKKEFREKVKKHYGGGNK